MNYLIFGGARDTGKSNSIYKIADFLISIKGYSVIGGHFPEAYAEFCCIVKKGDKIILIQSYTDNARTIRSLKQLLDSNIQISHVITANRNEGDGMRNKFRDILKINPSDFIFEIPLGKVVGGKDREENKLWYLNGIFEVAQEIIKTPNFNF